MKRCLIIAIILTVAACAGSSPRIDPSRISELQKGQSTVAEIIGKFGRPSVLSRNPDGTQTAIYVYDEGRTNTTTLVPLVATVPVDSDTFYFDTKGVLTHYKSTRAGTDKNAPADGNKSAQADSDKPAPAAPLKPAQGNTNTWSLRGLLPPSTTPNR